MELTKPFKKLLRIRRQKNSEAGSALAHSTDEVLVDSHLRGSKVSLKQDRRLIELLLVHPPSLRRPRQPVIPRTIAYPPLLMFVPDFRAILNNLLMGVVPDSCG